MRRSTGYFFIFLGVTFLLVVGTYLRQNSVLLVEKNAKTIPLLFSSSENTVIGYPPYVTYQKIPLGVYNYISPQKNVYVLDEKGKLYVTKPGDDKVYTASVTGTSAVIEQIEESPDGNFFFIKTPAQHATTFCIFKSINTGDFRCAIMNMPFVDGIGTWDSAEPHTLLIYRSDDTFIEWNLDEKNSAQIKKDEKKDEYDRLIALFKSHFAPLPTATHFLNILSYTPSNNQPSLRMRLPFLIKDQRVVDNNTILIKANQGIFLLDPLTREMSKLLTDDSLDGFSFVHPDILPSMKVREQVKPLQLPFLK
ncbi:hypothetical protein KBD59_04445 [Candidatus Gracilibacteria bacterium]|nr:hypothetical protein [Candidatus Gracilibacteria bacterium]